MADMKYSVVLEWDEHEQVFVTYVPALDFLSTFGATREEALARTREAITGYLEAATKAGIEVPAASDYEILDIAV